MTKRSTEHGYRSFAQYLIGLEKMAAGGRLALKASIGQFDFLHRTGLLDAVFPQRRVVVTERSDKIGQAVSWTIATQTLQWTSRQAKRPGDPAPSYDFDRIANYASTVSELHRHMEFYLALHGENFCRVLYEELAADPLGQMQRVLRFLGHENAAIAPAKARLEKQADAINAEFRARFIAEVAARHAQKRKNARNV